MARAERIFERLAVINRHFVLVRSRLRRIRHKVNVNDPGMGIVDRHADLRAVGLAQDGGEKQRMFLYLAVA